MPNRITRIGKQLLSSLLTISIYGLISYFLTVWLIGYSLVYAYLGNLALIVMVLTFDALMLRWYESDTFIARAKEHKDGERALRKLHQQVEGSVSFKTDLYLFYIFLLVASQIIEFNPALIGEEMGSFIFATRYSILLLVAIDMLIKQFTEDGERTRALSEKIGKELVD